MVRKRFYYFAAAAMLGLAVFAAGCADSVYTGSYEDNKPPEVWLSSGPVEGDTTSYKVHFYWGGWDPDGEIDHFEFIFVDGDPIGFNPADTTGLDKWFITNSYDSVISVTADENPRPFEENDLYT